jgi:hypothetical protein
VIGPEFDALWPFVEPDDPTTAIESPSMYYKGLLSDDPLIELANDPNGDQLIALLESIGGPSEQPRATVGVMGPYGRAA